MASASDREEKTEEKEAGEKKMCLPATQDKDMSVAGIIGSALTSAADVIETRALPPSRHHRQFEARLSDGSVLLLSLPLPLMVKLLRSERAASVSAEAAILAWIGNLNDHNHDHHHDHHHDNGNEDNEEDDDDDEDKDDDSGNDDEDNDDGSLSTPVIGPGSDVYPPAEGDPQQPQREQRLLATNRSTKTARSRVASQSTVSRSDIEFIPALVAHRRAQSPTGPEFNVMRPPRGSPLAGLSPPLTPSGRRAVNFQNGRLLRRLSEIRSPSGMFGPALGVLGRRAPSPPSRGAGPPGGGGSASARAWEPGGSSTWATAFAALLEGVLRDGEDMRVTLPYSTIRQHFWRLEHLLCAVTNACLVVVDAGEDDNTLVVRKAVSEPAVSNAGGSSRRLDGRASHGTTAEMTKNDTNNDNDMATKGKGDGNSSGQDDEKKSAPVTQDLEQVSSEAPDAQIIYSSVYGEEEVVVTGMRDWSNCIFGDPLFATAFHRGANEGLWSGFTTPADGEERPGYDPVEDGANAETRMALYECYHTIARVVREYYRPGKDNTKRELAARKALAGVLARLDRIPDKSTRRRRPSGEMSPAKRYKTDDDGGGSSNGGDGCA
ncbi:uncharacterized protein DNG_04003 [Cephalotrichum gorgonifer]|uniref:Uncharacterized protein n=1 Tax=Cephalotrichum gorgonifer TaxID=2041049 RepID=A0AAE8MV74_9PEZI|nr:uncharacterized protein DNG_04003 [Cephalotrichum gorgonifer]